ncbi:ERCC4 domain-containing protein [Schizophyllum fasciatum]
MSRRGSSRTRTKCANPELLSWLGELRDEQEEDSNYRIVLARAFKSMKEYPEVLTRIEDASRVKNIGPKIIGKLKEKQKEKTGFMSAHLDLSSMAGPSTAPPPEPKKRGRPKKADNNAASHSATPLSRHTSAPSIMATPAPVASSSRARHVLAASTTREHATHAPPPEASPQNPEVFVFTYLDVNHQPVRKRDDAYFNHTNDPPGYLIQYSEIYAKHSLVVEYCSPGIAVNRKVIAYLTNHAAFAFDVSPEFTAQPAPQTSAQSTTSQESPPKPEKRKLGALIADEEASQKRRCTGSLNPARQLPVQPPGNASTSFTTSRKSLGRSVTMPALDSSMPPPPAPAGAIARTTSLPNTARGQRSRPRLSTALPTMEIEVDLDDPYASAEHMTIPPFDPIVIPAEGYDIHLVLDNREVKSKKDRDGLAESLARKGVPVIREALGVGDVAWKAVRRRRQGNEYDEVTLDVILERKRFDDLWMSIKDGRFHEQKFRLHNSALTKIFYIVESYDRNRREEAKKSPMGKAFDTAISSTIVVDRFRVKETSHINDTIAYYATLHEMVKLRYQNQPLHIIPSHLVRRPTYLKLQKHLRHTQPHREHLTSFAQFQALNSKSGFTTVRETWARQLLRVNKMSAEKAGAIVQRYPCARALRDAFVEAEAAEREGRAAEAAEAREAGGAGGRRKKSEVRLAKHLLKDVGQGMRLVGESLSEKVYELMMADEYATAA